MAQYIYTMNRVGKVVPPKRVILRDISLSFFPGAKIAVLGLNGSGKSTLLRIMAGVDNEFEGEARPQPGIKIAFLPQEPKLDPAKDVRGNVEEAVSHIKDAIARLDQVYAAYAEPDADFDKSAAETGGMGVRPAGGRRREGARGRGRARGAARSNRRTQPGAHARGRGRRAAAAALGRRREPYLRRRAAAGAPLAPAPLPSRTRA